MLEFDTKIKKWGNSLGLIIPKSKIKDVKENDVIHVIAMKKNDSIKKSFGMFPEWKGKGQEMKDRLRKELYND